MRSDDTELRILAIDPFHKGFGYVVMEAPDLLVDWGVANVRGPKHSGCLRRLAGLIDQYGPDVVVIEDPEVDSRRWARVHKLLLDIRKWGEKRGLRVRMLSRRRVRKVFGQRNARTKEQIAAILALEFPELAERLPPPRKCYMSEDSRMSIFDAAALGVVLLDCLSVTVSQLTRSSLDAGVHQGRLEATDRWPLPPVTGPGAIHGNQVHPHQKLSLYSRRDTQL